MKVDILLSGFGGQGLMSLGKFLAQAAMINNKNTTWFPSYGAEVRGGTAYCFVKISQTAIASPLIEFPDIAVIFNQPSLDKFEERVKKGGLLIYNSDLVSRQPLNRGVQIIGLPLNKIALECDNIKVTNTVALGVLTALIPQILDRKVVIDILKETFNQEELTAQNFKAFYKGEKLAASHKL